ASGWRTTSSPPVRPLCRPGRVAPCPSTGSRRPAASWSASPTAVPGTRRAHACVRSAERSRGYDGGLRHHPLPPSMPVSHPSWQPRAPLQRLHFDWLADAGIELAVLRLDLLDPLLSGNKWFKL